MVRVSWESDEKSYYIKERIYKIGMINKFKDSSKDAWEEIKKGFVRSYDAFQDTYKNS